jgi:hypothetical protein
MTRKRHLLASHAHAMFPLLHVCVCVCVYACMHACMHACIFSHALLAKTLVSKQCATCAFACVCVQVCTCVLAHILSLREYFFPINVDQVCRAIFGRRQRLPRSRYMPIVCRCDPRAVSCLCFRLVQLLLCSEMCLYGTAFLKVLVYMLRGAL